VTLPLDNSFKDPNAIHLDVRHSPLKVSRDIFISTPSKRRRQYVFGYHVRPLTPISRDVIYLYLVEGFERVLAEIFVMSMGIAKKVSKVTGQRSRS